MGIFDSFSKMLFCVACVYGSVMLKYSHKLVVDFKVGHDEMRR